MGERDGGSENVDAAALRSGGEEERRGATGFTFRAWAAGVVVLLAGLVLILLGEDVADPIERGAVAPDFELAASSGDEKVTLSQFRGQVVLLNFWATWCKPCEDEIPSMEQLYRALRRQDEGFELLAVSVDESPTALRHFLNQHSISFPVLLDPQQQVSHLYQTRGFPESLLIDRRGRVVERYVGPRDWLTYRGRILELLREG
jgi:cytochrome c biogenesis protein CcmG/thiol:disulfide interchange protein DsbE